MLNQKESLFDLYMEMFNLKKKKNVLSTKKKKFKTKDNNKRSIKEKTKAKNKTIHTKKKN